MPRQPNYFIVERLRQQVISGQYDRMAFLPSERKLSEEFEVGRTVIRSAVQTLCREGILEMIPHRGVRVVHGAPRKAKLDRFMIRCGWALVQEAYETIGLLGGICMEASTRGAEAVLSFSPEALDEATLLERYRMGEIQGIIFIETIDSERLKKLLLGNGIPFIVANLESDESLPHSGMDFRAVGRMAGARIRKAKYSRPGVLTGPSDKFIFRELLAGFRGALAEDEIYLNPQSIFEINREQTGDTHAALRNCLLSPDRPDVFFVMRDARAANLYALCAELNITIPGDLGVISYDDITWKDGRAADLTTIKQDVYAIGREAVALLEEFHLTGKPPESIELSGTLIERGSLRG